MRVAVICTDKARHLETRMANRDAHLKHINDSGLVEMAGPFLDADGQMCGSLIVLDVEDMAQARQWVEDDPYGQAGLFEDVRLEIWNKVVG